MGVLSDNVIIGASAAGGAAVGKSLRCDGSSGYLSKTLGTPTDNKKWTLSLWFKSSVSSSNGQFLSAGGNQVFILGSNEFSFCGADSGTLVRMKTDQVFRDPSAWMHLVYTMDTTQAAFADQQKLYINGTQVTAFETSTAVTQNINTQVNSAIEHTVGRYAQASSEFWNGYLAEYYFIDGTILTPASFGEVDSATNQWIPKEPADIKAAVTFGSNGFYLDFSDADDLGNDSSGNGNDFTANSLVATDQMLDAPTNNFATMNTLARNVLVLSEGNLKATASSGGQETTGTLMPLTGKWYFEMLLQNFASNVEQFGITRTTAVIGSSYGEGVNYNTNGLKYVDSTSSAAYGATWTTGDIMAAAVDIDANSITFYKNNVSQGAISYAAGHHMIPMVRMGASGNIEVFNFGQDSSFAGNKTAQGNADENDIGDFYYTPPAGYLALCTDNLPDTGIALPGEYFNTALYTGNSPSSQSIDVGFKPDFTWLKARSNSADHEEYDSVRGGVLRLFPDTTAVESSGNPGFAFTSSGFDLAGTGSYGNSNESGWTFASWNWKAGGASTVTNNDGDEQSQVSVNNTAGISILTYTGTLSASGSRTVGHGMNVAPELIISKSRTNTADWAVQAPNALTAASYILRLNTTGAESNKSGNGTLSAPTASVFYTNYTDGLNVNARDYVAYCFASIEGYSKVGIFEGNTNVDGPFVYTGFRPAWLMIKNIDATAEWYMSNNKMSPYNLVDKILLADDASAQITAIVGDYTANGFKLRHSDPGMNGATMLYIAFAESPFKTSNAR